MIMAVFTFKNSLVLHDFDKLISFILHILPAKCMWAVTWFGKHNKGFLKFDLPEENLSFGGIFQYLTDLYIVYGCWLVFYYVMIFHIKKKDWETTFELAMKSSTSIKKFCYQFGSFLAPFIFISIHATFITVGALTSLFTFYSFWIHTIYILFVMVIAAKNGASYYIDYFSRKYE